MSCCLGLRVTGGLGFSSLLSFLLIGHHRARVLVGCLKLGIGRCPLKLGSLGSGVYIDIVGSEHSWFVVTEFSVAYLRSLEHLSFLHC